MIRKLEKKDIPFIRSYPGQMIGSADSAEAIEKVIFERKDARYYILDDDAPKGYIGLHQDVNQADIVTLYVPEPYRQQKVATKLLEYAIAMTQKEGVKKITLEVSDRNLYAIHLYQKMGFEKVHSRKEYYEDLSDAWVMMKEFK